MLIVCFESHFEHGGTSEDSLKTSSKKMEKDRGKDRGW